MHQLLGGESLIGVCGGQGCDARFLARVKIDVLGRDGLYIFGFDQGGGRIYGGLPIAAEIGRQRLRAVVRNLKKVI